MDTIDLKKITDERSQFIGNSGNIITKENYTSIMDNIYSYIKYISNDYYNKGFIRTEFDNILAAMLFIEETSHYNKIFDFDMPILYKNEKAPRDDYIKYLVYKTRRQTLKFYDRDKIDTRYIDYANKCIETAQELFRNCTKDGVKSYIVRVYPAYEHENSIENSLCCHYFNIVFYNNKCYLVDLTYAQFFTPHKNVFNRLGVMKADGCDVGRYMMQNDKSKMIVEKIIKEGFIEINEEIFKTYMDAFTLSFRNGLYYESNNINSFEVNYSIDDYIKFLQGEDDQINHEGIDNLGKQKRPLKKYNIDFNTFVK